MTTYREIDAYSGRQLHDKPLAIGGLTSYRYKGRYGWIMIGAHNIEDALREAGRSTNQPIDPAMLEVWGGDEYIKADGLNG